jgi:branched-chain amino acid transport system ATP-binding protein
VNEVNMEVEQGDLTAIIGPNGAGKSTLLNLMSGHTMPTSGSVVFDGRTVSGLPRHTMCRIGIGRNFQQPTYFPDLTVLQNVQVPLVRKEGRHLQIWGDTTALCVVEAKQILAEVALLDAAGTMAGLLSYGDQRRLEIAIALGSGPRLLLLDEPTAGLPGSERRILTDLIERLNRDRMITVLFTEHDMDVVFSVARRVHVLHQGEVIATGTPAEIRQDATVRRVYLGEDF